MTQNLPITLQSSFSCLLGYGQIGLRFVRWKCFPWLMLASILLQLPFVSKSKRSCLRNQYFTAIVRIDFISVYELLNDLLW